MKTDPSKRQAVLRAEAKTLLESAMDILDQLAVHQAAAHVDLALHILNDHIPPAKTPR